MHGGKRLHCGFESMAHSSFISENIDRELSFDDLKTANGGIVWWLVGAMLLIPAVANAPSEKDDNGVARLGKNKKFNSKKS